MVKAPLAREAVGLNPTDRGGNVTKRSLLVDARVIPLSLVVSDAQRHDVKLLEPTLAALVVRRPKAKVQHLCADKGYVGKPAELVIVQWKYVPHVRQRGEERQARKHKRRYRPKRWVVERTHSWLNRFRKLLVRYEKLAASYEGLLEIACAIIVFQRSLFIYG